MTSLNGYLQWQELFDENVSKVWIEESIPVLKNLSMMLFSINREIKRIEDALHAKVSHLRNYLDEHRSLPDSNWKSEPDHTLTHKTKNAMPKTHKTTEVGALHIEELTLTPSKELSRDETSSIIMSDDDVQNPVNINSSPEIKKKYRHNDLKRKLKKKRKFNEGNIATKSVLRQLKDVANVAVRSFKENEEYIKQNDTSLDFMEEVSIPYKAMEKSLRFNKNTQIVHTPQKSDSDLDFSIVQCTPVSKIVPSERKDKMPSYILKKRNRLANNSTLTQMFFKKGQSKEVLRNYDSDETLVSTNRTMEIESVMGITKMVSYLNKESDAGIADNSDIHSSSNSAHVSNSIASLRYKEFEENTSLNSAMLEENHSIMEQDLSNGLNEFLAKVQKSKEFEENTSLNSAMLEENHSIMEQNLSNGLNEFLAKVQNVPEQLEAAPTVRGKARQNLPGWSCKECEKFYLNQGLNPDEIVALNKCSKHRGHYRPREDTLPGFWDMDVASQETEKP